VDAGDLDLPQPLDRTAYRRAMERLTSRGLVENGRLTRYGHEVEAMPVDRPWAELLVHADPELVPMVAVCSNIDSLHRMTREERDLHGAQVNGSDHLTAYNLFAEAVNQCGSIGEVYGLPRHVFVEEELATWAERRGVLVKAIEEPRSHGVGARALEHRRALPTHRRRSGGNGSSSSPASCRSTSSSTSGRRTARRRASPRHRWRAAGARWRAPSASSPTGSAPRAPASRAPPFRTTWARPCHGEAEGRRRAAQACDSSPSGGSTITASI
jgi:hypothetical protein